MAKNKVKPTKDISNNKSENSEMEKSDIVLSEVKTKQLKEDKSLVKDKNKNANKKKVKTEKPKRNFFKGIFSELKKVSWPTFKQTCARTGTVLVICAVFMVVVLGIDMFLTWLVSLIIV